MSAVYIDVIPDFRGVENFKEIQEKFIIAARAIILQHELVYRERRFDITALELYLKLHATPSIWCDRATDSDKLSDEQFNTGTWYIRQKKGPAYWQIDITAGSRSQGIQAGLLLRQLEDEGGPATALHRIIRGRFGRKSWEPEEYELMKQIHGRKVDGSDGSPLMLKLRSAALTTELGKGKRINLPKNDDHNFEGILIRTAKLRVGTWRRYSTDEPLN
jgi:hypothetical protein